MKLHYKGKFDGNVESLPHGEHKPGAVKFREPESTKKLAIIANGIALAMYVVLMPIYVIRSGFEPLTMVGFILAFLTLFPHEFLHGICFREDVYLYTNWKQGMLFVVGPEDMSKLRFVLMSLCPNVVFGVIPFVLFLIQPEWEILGAMGAMAIPMGAGDYLNVFNALTQMPKGARTYLHGFNSWWYMPEERGSI